MQLRARIGRDLEARWLLLVAVHYCTYSSGGSQLGSSYFYSHKQRSSVAVIMGLHLLSPQRKTMKTSVGEAVG